jgi:hypothetical protein
MSQAKSADTTNPSRRTLLATVPATMAAMAIPAEIEAAAKEFPLRLAQTLHRLTG